MTFLTLNSPTLGTWLWSAPLTFTSRVLVRVVFRLWSNYRCKLLGWLLCGHWNAGGPKGMGGLHPRRHMAEGLTSAFGWQPRWVRHCWNLELKRNKQSWFMEAWKGRQPTALQHYILWVRTWWNLDRALWGGGKRKRNGEWGEEEEDETLTFTGGE